MLCYSRLSVRLSIAGGTVYVTTEEGLWGSPEESILFYQKVKELVKPGVETVFTKDHQEQLSAAVQKVSISLFQFLYC